MKKAGKVSWYVVVAFLLLIGIGASIIHYMGEPYNKGFLDFPVLTALHVVPGGIYLLLAPFQLLPGIRRRSLSYHRKMGRVLLFLGIIVGFSALGLAIFTPFSGWLESVIIGIFGCYFLYSIYAGYCSIRKKEIIQHRNWMIRAFAIGLSIATMRLIFVPSLILLKVNSYEMAANLSITAFTIAFVLHTIGAEIYIWQLGPKKTSQLTRILNNEIPVSSSAKG